MSSATKNLTITTSLEPAQSTSESSELVTTVISTTTATASPEEHSEHTIPVVNLPDPLVQDPETVQKLSSARTWSAPSSSHASSSTETQPHLREKYHHHSLDIHTPFHLLSRIPSKIARLGLPNQSRVRSHPALTTKGSRFLPLLRLRLTNERTKN
jgi:hypothetical protein